MPRIQSSIVQVDRAENSRNISPSLAYFQDTPGSQVDDDFLIRTPLLLLGLCFLFLFFFFLFVFNKDSLEAFGSALSRRNGCVGKCCDLRTLIVVGVVVVIAAVAAAAFFFFVFMKGSLWSASTTRFRREVWYLCLRFAESALSLSGRPWSRRLRSMSLLNLSQSVRPWSAVQAATKTSAGTTTPRSSSGARSVTLRKRS